MKGIESDLISLTGARALTQHLIDLGHRHIAMVSGPLSISTSRERLQTLLQNGIDYRDDYVKEASYNQQISVPEDIAIVTFDEMEPYCAVAEPFLTSALQHAYNFGSLGVQLLMERIEGVPVTQPRRIVLNPDIVIRRSSGEKL